MGASAGGPRHGMLMVLMEPPPSLVPEFQDWYDLEHVPQREAIEGFHTSTRWICTGGWPRYMAAYDLESLGVLDEKPYQEIAGANASPWSRRILARVFGYQRFLMEQMTPGRALMPDRSQGLAVIRFAGRLAAELEVGIQSLGLQEPCQARIFETRGAAEPETLIVVDAPAQDLIPSWDAAFHATTFGQNASRMIGVWRYLRYWRSAS